MAKTPNTANQNLPSDQDQLDKAAVCMAETDLLSCCSKDILKFLCGVFWCATAHPFQKGNKHYKQVCADKLLTGLRSMQNDNNKNEFGTYGNLRYYNSLYHIMSPSKEEIKKNDTEEYSYMNINGTLQKCKIRIPDISIYDENMQLAQIYDFKFKGDRIHENQHRDYLRLVGRQKDKVNYIKEDTCKDKNGNKIGGKSKTLSQKEKKAMIEKMHAALPEFYS